jgi:hypothetical protein
LAIFCITKDQIKWSFLLITFVYACLTHGLFDALLFKGYTVSIVIAFTIFSYYFVLSLLSFTSAISPFRMTLEKYVEQYPQPQEQPGLECLHCSDNNPKLSYAIGAMTVQKCSGCGYFVATKQTLFKLFYRFGARYNTLVHRYRNSQGKSGKLLTLYGGNYFSDEKKLTFFKLDELSQELERSRQETVSRMGIFFRFLSVPGRITQ